MLCTLAARYVILALQKNHSKRKEIISPCTFFSTAFIRSEETYTNTLTHTNLHMHKYMRSQILFCVSSFLYLCTSTYISYRSHWHALPRIPPSCSDLQRFHPCIFIFFSSLLLFHAITPPSLLFFFNDEWLLRAREGLQYWRNCSRWKNAKWGALSRWPTGARDHRRMCIAPSHHREHLYASRAAFNWLCVSKPNMLFSTCLYSAKQMWNRCKHFPYGIDECYGWQLDANSFVPDFFWFPTVCRHHR